jgi:nitrate/nitrite transporter NarK
MGPFIGESFGLTPSQQGFMISVPILAGALMRFPLGVLAQWPACTVFGGPPLAYAPRGAFVSECSV